MTEFMMTRSRMAYDHQAETDTAPEHGLLLDAGHEHATLDFFPRLTNMSAAVMFKQILRGRGRAMTCSPVARGRGIIWARP